MGILRDGSDRKPLRIEEAIELAPQITYADYLFESDSEDDSADETQNSMPTDLSAFMSKRKKSKYERAIRNFRRSTELGTDGVNVKKNMGARKWRRVENARLLMSLADPQDICYDYTDIVQPTVTAFSRILREKECMQAWNDFIDKDEKEQRRILKKLDEEAKEHHDLKPTTSAKSPTKLLHGDDKREHHPAYSARACFERLDKKFKTALNKGRGLPMGLIEELELRLREFFDAAPDGVWIDVVDSGTERFYLHCLAQFLALQSATIHDDQGPDKIVEVRNRRSLFIPPHDYLAHFLVERKRKSSH